MDPIPYSRQSINKDDIDMVTRTMNSDFLTQGPKIRDFENAIEQTLKVKHAVACSSGTSALHLAYSAAGITAKSLGIVPAITFAATANALRYQGAEVKFCDVDPKTGLICTDSLEEVIRGIPDSQKEELNIIASVSFAGRVAPLPKCAEIAKANNFILIEDASHSPGAWVKNDIGDDKYFSANGEFALASTLSFHPVKHVCSGEGGAVLTNNSELAEKAARLRSHGINRPYDDKDEMPWYYEQEDLGWNYRLTDLQASLGHSQINRLNDFLSKRRRIARRYDELLSKEPFKKYISPPPYEDGHAWHIYIIQFLEKGHRNLAYKFLKERKIFTQIHYIPVYRHPYYQNLIGSMSLPGAETYFESCLSIPLYPNLSEQQQDRVLECLALFLEKG
jgi:UDP-4-amino-4,6-dideoxy-N-acetyl-beta-L-altrosamine transaminase